MAKGGLNKEAAWESISNAVNRLFELKRYPELANTLTDLNEKIRAISKSEVGLFMGEYYQDHILSNCMDKLRLDLIQERGSSLVSKLADTWTQFYTSILPTLLAMFASVQPQQNKMSIRSLTLISFRDMLLLRTDFSNALDQCYEPLPPQIQQMLLILQSVHRATPSPQFFDLQTLVGKVVDSYFPMVIKTTHPQAYSSRTLTRLPQEEHYGRTVRAGTADFLEKGVESSGSMDRRHSLGHVDKEDTPEPVTRL